MYKTLDCFERSRNVALQRKSSLSRGCHFFARRQQNKTSKRKTSGLDFELKARLIKKIGLNIP